MSREAVTDPLLDAPCGSIVDGKIRRGSYWREATWEERLAGGAPPLHRDDERPPDRPIKTRIADAYRDLLRKHCEVTYHALLEAVFPPTWYPRAWRRSVNGGPPGCAMPFGHALRQMGGSRTGIGGAAIIYIPAAAVRELATPEPPTPAPPPPSRPAP